MIFKQIPIGPMQNFSYIIADESTKEAVLIDAGWDVDLVLDAAAHDNLKIIKIILTHSHFDHVQKINEFALKTDAQVCIHENDFADLSKIIGHNPIKITKLKGDETITLGKLKFKILHTPGHTKGAICILVENKLVTGDTLFVGAIGRTDLEGSNAPQLFESLQKLKKLDAKTQIYPGHDYGEQPHSTIEEELSSNPYFMCRTKQEFLKLVSH